MLMMKVTHQSLDIPNWDRYIHDVRKEITVAGQQSERSASSLMNLGRAKQEEGEAEDDQ